MNQTAIVQLGRFGDIINILPVAKHIHDTENEAPCFVVAEQYASILEGVSYVKPIPVKCEFPDIQRGINVARQHAKLVRVSQVYGWNWKLHQQMDSFCKESWLQAGFLSLWDQLPLTFDRRSAEREQDLRLFFQTHNDNRPILLVSFGGQSSPYSNAGELKMMIESRLSDDFRIIDLTPARCHRIYDLLGLYDVAHCLITIDTATMHLAQAAPNLKVIALVTDHPTLWHGATPPRNTCLHMRYVESAYRMDYLVECIRSGAIFNDH